MRKSWNRSRITIAAARSAINARLCSQSILNGNDDSTATGVSSLMTPGMAANTGVDTRTRKLTAPAARPARLPKSGMVMSGRTSSTARMNGPCGRTIPPRNASRYPEAMLIRARTRWSARQERVPRTMIT